MNGTFNIIVAILKNTETEEEAAHMLLRLFGTPQTEDQPEAASAPPPPPPAPAAAKAKANSSPRKRTAAPSADVVPLSPDDIDPMQYYTMDVLSKHSGYSMNYLHVMIRDNRLESKKEPNGRRLVLGSEILRLRAQRANGGAEHDEHSQRSPAAAAPSPTREGPL